MSPIAAADRPAALSADQVIHRNLYGNLAEQDLKLDECGLWLRDMLAFRVQLHGVLSSR